MRTSIFEERDILVQKKHSNITFEEFVQNVPSDFNGYLLKTIDTDTIGRSNANPRWGQIFEYQKGKISKKRYSNI